MMFTGGENVYSGEIGSIDLTGIPPFVKPRLRSACPIRNGRTCEALRSPEAKAHSVTADDLMLSAGEVLRVILPRRIRVF